MASLRHEYNLDLLDVFRDKISVDEVWELLMQLPRDSAFMAEIAADPFFATDAPPKPPTLREYSPVVEALAAVRDEVASLRQVVIAVAGGKPSPLKPYPRPALPSQKLRQERERRDWEHWAALLTGQKEV